MALQTRLTRAVFISIFIHKVLGCLQINTSCNHINTAGGFRFTHRCPEGSEIILTHNTTPIAYAVLGTQNRRHLDEVKSLGDDSVVTRHCKDLLVKCLVPNGLFRGESSVKEICELHKITEQLKDIDPPNPVNLTIVAVIISLVVILLIIIGMYISWKKKLHLVPPFPVILRHLRTCSGRPEVQQVTADVNTTQHNGDISLRDDPGGVHDNGGTCIVRIRENGHSGQTLGDHSPEDGGRGDRGPEGQPLLSDQRAASRRSDMTGGAVALAYEHGFDPDPVSRCSTAPDTDVESTSSMKNP